ncbi:hypothetical protein SAMN02746041_01122 [Desulfacinum hydrothermale DSM 13146]|uniref:Uncharacterized protein n=1 Tax=Desulfacinum hydrothermale DSM 13146 TaxID=1121390 RepID=A0A1W1XB38_9BACT|nr:hypothetical protein [Desulfacinum hydrothermale]SMC21077.1 hypothetical protein SAMN02746041_01122 [Desulfacinum hydrothermale DSM 13146]
MSSKVKVRNNVIAFPTVAQPNIDRIFERFLREQRERLKPRTYQRYEEIITLFQTSLNLYGYQELPTPGENTLYRRLADYKDQTFCSIFGPEKIPSGVSTFLTYFMIRKVMASESLLRAAGTVTKKLMKWLVENNYAPKGEARKAMELASQASKELPAAERLARLLYDFAQTHPPRMWTDELDDYFVVEEVRPGMLILSGLTTEEGPLEVKVPRIISEHCKVGWQINLLLGETRMGWRILESGNVYPL